MKPMAARVRSSVTCSWSRPRFGVRPVRRPVRDRELVVRVRNPLEEVEAVTGRKKLRLVGEVAEVPLADHPGGVARGAQRLGERDLGRRQTRDVGVVEVARAEPRAELGGRERQALRQRGVAREMMKEPGAADSGR
jgi:hypothetical protein